MSVPAAYLNVQKTNPAELVNQHAELVKRIAYQLVARLPSSVDVDDLIQSGMIGLIEAARGYDAGQGASFETYAAIRIRGAMIDEIRKGDWAPRSVHRKLREATEITRQIEQATGKEASPKQIAKQMGVSLDEYYAIIQDASRCQMMSLDGHDSEDDPRHEPGYDGDGPMGLLEQDEFRDALAEGILSLPEREKLVMSMYYRDELNLREIGAVLEVSESRVCQIHGQALVRLRARLADHIQSGAN